MTSEMMLINIMAAAGGVFTGGSTAFVFISKASIKKFNEFEKKCDLKYTTKQAFGNVEVKIGAINTSLANIEKSMDKMEEFLYQNLKK